MDGSSLANSRRLWHTKQLHLTSTPQGTLCIFPIPASPDPIQYPAKCFISVLPEELLTNILELLPLPAGAHHAREYRQRIGLSRVCKRWQRIWRRVYEPLIYRCLDLGTHGRRRTDRMRKLLETLRWRPDLRGYVRRLDIILPEEYSEKFDSTTVAEILQQCRPFVHEMSMYGSFEDSGLCEIVHTLNGCEIPNLCMTRGNRGLQIFLDYFNIPSLRTLRLDRYGSAHNINPGAPWKSRSGTSNSSNSSTSLLAEQFARYIGKSSVTSLDLHSPCAKISTTALLLRWPARLVNFRLTGLLHSGFAQWYTPLAVRRILLHHQESLENIYLDMLVCPDFNNWQVMDFSGFSQLSVLRMSSYNLFGEKPLVAARKLTGGTSLKDLHISFDTEDQHSESAEDFGPERMHWLEDFVTAMTAEGEMMSNDRPLHKLENIHIQFDPDDEPDFYDYESMSAQPGTNPAWPWEHVEQTAKALDHFGVKVSHSPRISRRDWNRQIEELARRNCEQVPEEINVFTLASEEAAGTGNGGTMTLMSDDDDDESKYSTLQNYETDFSTSEIKTRGITHYFKPVG